MIQVSAPFSQRTKNITVVEQIEFITHCSEGKYISWEVCDISVRKYWKRLNRGIETLLGNLGDSLRKWRLALD